MPGSILKTLRVRLEADSRDLLVGIDKVANDLAGVGRSLQNTGSMLTRAVTLPLAGIGAAAFKMAVDAEEAANKFNVVMGGAAEETRAKLQQLTDTIPLTRQEMEKMAAGVQDMLVPMGVAREEAAGMSVDMVQLAGDLASFNNVGTEDVLMAIQSALAGSSEPMRRFGVDTRVTRLEALALESGLIKEGEALDNTSTALAVLMAIQKDSTDAMGDAARTAESSANQMRFLWREVKELGITIGEILIPVVTPLISHLKDLIAKFGDLSPRTQKIIVLAGALAAAIGPVLVAFGTMLTLLPQMVAGIKLVGTALTFLSANPIGAAVVAIGALVTAGILVIKHWDELKAAAEWVVDRIRQYFGEMATWVRDKMRWLIDGIRDFFLGGLERLVDGVREKLDAIKGFFGNLAQTLVGGSIVPEMVDSILGNFDRMGAGMVTMSAAGTAGVRSSFEEMNADVSMGTGEAFGRIADLFSEFGVEGPSIIEGIVGDIEGKWDRIKDVLEIPAVEAFKNTKDKWMEYAKEIFGVLKWLWDHVKDWIGKLSSALQFGGQINIQGPMGGAGGFGTGVGQGGGTVVVGPTNTEGLTTSYEWARLYTYQANQLRVLEEIRDNTNYLKPGMNEGTGMAGTNKPTPDFFSGAALAGFIDEQLNRLIARDNRAAGFVEV